MESKGGGSQTVEYSTIRMRACHSSTPVPLFVALCVLSLAVSGCSTRTYDLVIANGRVRDPESGFDRIRHVGIAGDRIDAISDQPLRGTRTIDATGLVVAPGFIELHTHGEDNA